MLSDAQIERYSRQILVPEVGARGQVRLLAARVGIAGAGAAVAAAARLLGRAGVGALDLAADVPPLPELSPDCRVRRAIPFGAAPAPDLIVDGAGGSAARAGVPAVLAGLQGRTAGVEALVGRPCVACRDGSPPAPPDALLAADAAALGALAAGEAIRLLLDPSAGGRVTTLGLDTGELAARALPASAGCTACGGHA